MWHGDMTLRQGDGCDGFSNLSQLMSTDILGFPKVSSPLPISLCLFSSLRGASKRRRRVQGPRVQGRTGLRWGEEGRSC